MAGSGRLDGKVAVITGGASGIGAGTARRFVAEGAQVVLADLQADAGSALAAELGAAARFAQTDVTQEDDVAAAVDLAVGEFGRLDVMFNNAGIVGVIGPMADTPTDGWDQTVAILLRGVFLGMKHAARVMVPQRSGSIISTSSTAGIIGGLGPHCYTTCKHGVIGMTKSVASELAAHGIRVNVISPGSIVTALDLRRHHGRPHGAGSRRRADRRHVAARHRRRPGGHRQRRALPRQRRVPCRHRPHPRRGRRDDDDVATGSVPPPADDGDARSWAAHVSQTVLSTRPRELLR